MQIVHDDALQLEPWMSWVQTYAELLLRCAARWARGQASGAADALPGIRLLPDSYFTKHLDEVHTTGPFTLLPAAVPYLCNISHQQITSHAVAAAGCQSCE